jgi:hypothetical protein
MELFDAAGAYSLFLSATLSSSRNRQRIHLVLRDRAGNHGAGELDLETQAGLDTGDTWGEFCAHYLSARTGAGDHQSFGRALFGALLACDPTMAEAWSGISAGAAGRPLRLTVSFGRHTETFARLPLELLHDDSGFLFSRPDSALVRTLENLPAAEFVYPSTARVLFAWAHPPGAGTEFDPEPHRQALRAVFGGQLSIIDDAGLESIEEALADARKDSRPFDFLHLLAHGSHDGDFGSIALCRPDGQLDLVEAQRLAAVVRGRGVRLAFLCSCQSAVSHEHSLSGVAQQLLDARGGDLSRVIATQANLPVARSAELARSFYQLLAQAPHRPSTALGRARVMAYQGSQVADAWSVPICLSRPALVSEGDDTVVLRPRRVSLPARRDTYQERPVLLDAIINALRAHRLVTVVGLPGIGKTELGIEAARALQQRRPALRVIYQQANRRLDGSTLRALIATAVGVERSPEDDPALGALLADRAGLIVIDNAEDMMADARGQAAFAVQLDTWLAAAPGLRVLLTSRWSVTGTREREHALDIPPMSRAQTEALLRAELEAADSYREAWGGDPDWQRLLDFLDGHPRSVWLVSHHFEGPRASLAAIVARLEQKRARAVIDPSLFGRADLAEALDDPAEGRMRSLVASIDFSFEVVAARHPEAAQAFLVLSLFPAGLPESVALAVAGGADGMALEPLVSLSSNGMARQSQLLPGAFALVCGVQARGWRHRWRYRSRALSGRGLARLW